MTEPPINDQLDEILANYVLSEEAGDPVSRDDLLKRHPDLADELNAFFSGRDRFKRLASPLSPEAARRNDLPAKLRYFGDYELLEEVAQGGMGVVYKARQTSLDRIVAVKMILAGHLATDADVKRFAGEAETAASLKHKAIVPIHEVGQQNGQHYFSMDFIEGRNLAEVIRTAPISPEEAAGIVKTIAEAVDYAHSEGIVHRDIKPSNILIDDSGHVHITDFGLAFRVEVDSDLTRTGQVLGTPRYMPPEQAQGKRDLVGPASDIYSLGAVLYELLAGRPPFRGESAADTIRQLLDTEPLSPRQLNRDTSRDLETICLKCLEKEPHKRYGTAALLADDLGRLLAGEPVLARPCGRLQRTIKWIRRRPTDAALIGVTTLGALLLIVGLCASNTLITDALHERTALLNRVQDERNRVSRLLYFSQIQNALTASRDAQPDGALEILQKQTDASPERADDRSVEWDYLWHLTHKQLLKVEDHANGVTKAVFTADGSRIVSSSMDGTIRVRDAHSGTELKAIDVDPRGLVDFAMNRDATLAVAISRSGVKMIVLNLETGGELFVRRAHTSPMSGVVAMDSDGKRIAAAGNDKITVWDLDSGQEALTIGEGFRGRVVTYSPDGKWIFAGTFDGRIGIWDAENGDQVSVLNHQDISRIYSLAVSPDGNKLAAGRLDGTITIWDLVQGKLIHSFHRHRSIVCCVSFDPDGTQLASAGFDRIVKVWDLNLRRKSFEIRGHTGIVRCVSFNLHGSKLVTASDDRTIKVWHARDAGDVHRLPKGNIEGVSDDGRRLAMSGQVLDLSTGNMLFESPTSQGTLSPDGQSYITANAVWSVDTGQKVCTLNPDQSAVACISPNGRYMATISGDFVQIWDARNGDELCDFQQHRAGVRAVTFGRDNNTVASLGDDAFRVWEVVGGRQLSEIGANSFVDLGSSVKISPSLDRVGCTKGDQVLVWDVHAPRDPLVFSGHFDTVNDFVFSSDGKRIATCSRDKSIKIWDVESGHEILSLSDNNVIGTLRRIVISAGGSRLISTEDEPWGRAFVWGSAIQRKNTVK